MPKQLATWNTARDAWEKPDTEGLICGHLAVYSATFPTSGSMRSGVVSERPKWEPATPGSGSSSLLPTVTVSETTGPGRGPKKTGGENLRTAVTLLPTVTTQDAANTGGPSQFKRNTPPLNTRVLMLPTQSATAGEKLFRTPCAAEAAGGPRNPDRPGATMRLSDQVREEVWRGRLLPTPAAVDGNGTGNAQSLEALKAGKHQTHTTDIPRLLQLSTGETTNRRSAAGNAPSAAQLPGQLSLLDEMEQSA